jgi:serine/threonine protein kinase
MLNSVVAFHFAQEDVVGMGASGTVRLAVWNGIEVAVKCFEVGNLVEKEAVKVSKEATILFHCRHPNILHLHGTQ